MSFTTSIGMKLLLSTILMLSILKMGFSQSKKVVTDEQNELKVFCGKWILTTMSRQDRSVTVPVSEANYIFYKEDGTYTDSSSRFKVTHGTWAYDSKTQFLYVNEVGGKSKFKVVSVTQDSLILKFDVPGIVITTIYRKIE